MAGWLIFSLPYLVCYVVSRARRAADPSHADHSSKVCAGRHNPL